MEDSARFSLLPMFILNAGKLLELVASSHALLLKPWPEYYEVPVQYRIKIERLIENRIGPKLFKQIRQIVPNQPSVHYFECDLLASDPRWKLLQDTLASEKFYPRLLASAGVKQNPNRTYDISAYAVYSHDELSGAEYVAITAENNYRDFARGPKADHLRQMSYILEELNACTLFEAQRTGRDTPPFWMVPDKIRKQLVKAKLVGVQYKKIVFGVSEEEGLHANETTWLPEDGYGGPWYRLQIPELPSFCFDTTQKLPNVPYYNIPLCFSREQLTGFTADVAVSSESNDSWNSSLVLTRRAYQVFHDLGLTGNYAPVIVKE